MGRAARFLFAVGVLLALIGALLAGANWAVCAPPATLTGFWATPSGDLVQLAEAPGAPGEAALAATSASGVFGARVGAAYPCCRTGCRTYTVAFPRATLQGRVSTDRRTIDWDRAPRWVRQGFRAPFAAAP